MTTLLVRLKPFDPRRGNILQRFTYAGIKFYEARGWYRVDTEVAAYLRTVHQRPDDPHTPLAFDVCTDDEAKALEQRDKEAATPRKTATDDIEVSPARIDGTVAPRKLGTEDAAPPLRVDGAATAPRKAATDDASSSTARPERTPAPAGAADPARDDRKPAPATEAPEPAKDDRRPSAAAVPKKDRP